MAHSQWIPSKCSLHTLHVHCTSLAQHKNSMKLQADASTDTFQFSHQYYSSTTCSQLTTLTPTNYPQSQSSTTHANTIQWAYTNTIQRAYICVPLCEFGPTNFLLEGPKSQTDTLVITHACTHICPVHSAVFYMTFSFPWTTITVTTACTGVSQKPFFLTDRSTCYYHKSKQKKAGDVFLSYEYILQVHHSACFYSKNYSTVACFPLFYPKSNTDASD